jgi:hypothetical protein
MWKLMVEGGYPMWFLLAFGLAGTVAAIRYTLHPTPRDLYRVIGLATTTLFSTLFGTAVDLATFGHRAPDYLKAHPEQSLSEVVLLGLGESMSPGVVGFDLLTLMALLVSFGLYRRISETHGD